MICGAGSIGERHIRNLWSMGFVNLIVYRQRNLPFRDIADAQVKIVLNWEEALQLKPQIAFICTPSSQHIQQAIDCITQNMHVFIEKPLSHNLEHFDELISFVRIKNKIVQVAFMMRFHPLIKHVKQAAEEQLYGKLISMRSHWGSYLPDWHPWEDYKESYAAKKSLGGGVALTLCHDIDLALWIANAELKNYSSTFQFSDELGIETESVADFHFEFANGSQGDVHLNYLDNPPIRNYHFEFEEAVISFDYFNNSMEIRSQQPEFTSTIDAKQFDRNTLYIDEVNHFMNQIEINSNPADYSLQQVNHSRLITKICTT